MWTGIHTKVGEKLTCDKTLSLSLGGDGPSVIYNLSSVIHHSGAPEKGHYTATLCDTNTNKMWYCNDSSVEVTKRINHKTASILFYRKEE